MTTFTVELDADTADALSKVANERSIPTESLIAAAAEWWLVDQAAEGDWSAEDIVAIEEGIAQLDRGESISHEEVMTAMRAKYAG
jgi:predicted transcriptional regulator